MKMINDKLLNWASLLEDAAREQAEQTSMLPFIHPHVALMPDAHHGKGAVVGSCIPTDRAIIPAAVGVDIGCGMNAVLTQFHIDQFRERGRPLSELREAIERAVPLGTGQLTAAVSSTALPRIDELDALAVKAQFEPGYIAPNWMRQLGTLGAGNHFIELTADEQGRVWLFLHSGSRGVGNKIANKHIRVAAELCKKWWVPLPNPDLAYLVEGTDEFWTYIRELRWAQHFALLNRAEMMDRVADCVSEWMGETVERGEEIACHHNYTEKERHFGREVWMSRKGAINAAKGVPGLIPGSMGTASYVVVGKGNPLALDSSPHGAGRQYSRSKARKTFTHDQLREAMAGIEFRDTDAFLDEIPAAYKDIDVVMADAADLVAIRHTLRQFVNVKGD